MTEGTILFEQPHRGDVWRLQLSEWKGEQRLNWRKWYWSGDELKPGKEGCTIPVERLSDLTAALMAHHGLTVPPSLGSLS